MNEKEAFEKAIQDNRYDQTLRWAYADWLEMNGFDNEAKIQRSWTREKQESEDWLLDYIRRLNEYYDSGINYEELLEICQCELNGKYHDKSCLPVVTPDFVRESQEELWLHYHRVTERPIKGTGELQPFSCSC